ncbi:EAL domain-containing protein [Shewanella aestuarii]|uniref:EAL domain-containing protein n=1 Tax=Shewanella aestuarii TaxID=1028752 RepID=A0A6G9QLF6_9GAMM|nr:EAL domain-containing protein [Shewanella aestuarii]QIR14671.1 EAL domain-containing protein [Shewanella aestuarii]
MKNNLLNNLIEYIPVGIVVHGSQSEILFSNKMASDILGLSRAQMQGKDALDPAWHFAHPDGYTLAVDDYPVNRVFKSKEGLWGMILKVYRPISHDSAWVLCNAFPSFDECGEISEVITCFIDITSVKNAENALKSSEERLNLILQGTNDAAWDWDICQHNVYLSSRWWQMIGREPNELEATEDLLFKLLHPDDLKKIMNRVAELMLPFGPSSFEAEFRLQTKSGDYLPVLSRGVVLRDSDGTALRFSGANMDLTERKESEDRIYRLAFHDVLTGLANRTFLMEHLKSVLARYGNSKQFGALLLIDLDNFKIINDTKGHDVGDELLKLVSKRLLTAARDCDFVARLGGDEFVVVLDYLTSEKHSASHMAESIGKKIIELLSKPFVFADQTLLTTPSIGITMFGQRNKQQDELLKQADLAMYHAKENGKNTLSLFEPAMQFKVEKRVELAKDLRDGLVNDEFILFCQPQMDALGKLCGGEVLIRWQHPVLGLVMPNEFIPLAEQTDLIIPIGEWVLRRTCEILCEWEQNSALKHLTLSVNVSVNQVLASNFVERVLTIIDDNGANPSLIILELTESLLAEHVEDIIFKMNELNKRGVRFSIDDFGTGYSSLNYLKRFPLTELKIDQSFVRDIPSDKNDAVITEIIITLAQKLGLRVLAEGVETEEQLQFLLDHDCQYFQGYLFGKPSPIELFAGIAEANSAKLLYSFGKR